MYQNTKHELWFEADKDNKTIKLYIASGSKAEIIGYSTDEVEKAFKALQEAIATQKSPTTASTPTVRSTKPGANPAAAAPSATNKIGAKAGALAEKIVDVRDALPMKLAGANTPSGIKVRITDPGTNVLVYREIHLRCSERLTRFV